MKTHGAWGTVEFRAYWAMRSRCLNPKNKEFRNYGGRGITICDRWLNGQGDLSGIECFLLDMGEKPSQSHTLDRIDNDGPYSPINCRWASTKEQAKNRRGSIFVDGVPLVDWCAARGFLYHTIKDRYARGDRGEVLARPVYLSRRWHGSRVVRRKPMDEAAG